LRVLKHRALLEDVHDPDAFAGLCKLKMFSPFNCILRDIGFDPFFLHYWSPTQINAYRLFAKKHKTDLAVFIDATGGVVKPLSQKGSHIYYSFMK